MWRGGLSGEESFYMHGDRPLRTPDQTSPYLHELFHVAAPFRPHADAHWVTEGLAEYYSIELQRRIGALSNTSYQRALQLFAEHGVWGHDFTRTSAPALRNNSAPLVMYLLDQQIRAATGDERGLDAVVASLARDGGIVSTAHFLGTIERVAGKSFASFFRRHVYRGEQPVISSLPP
jgi:predicted metalloprotease with PDZ domain